MSESEIISAIDRATAEARFNCYVLLDVNEALGTRLDAYLAEVTDLAKKRLMALQAKQRGRATDRDALNRAL